MADQKNFKKPQKPDSYKRQVDAMVSGTIPKY